MGRKSIKQQIKEATENEDWELVQKLLNKKGVKTPKKTKLTREEELIQDSIETSKRFNPQAKSYRPAFSMLKIKCDVCGKTVEIHPMEKPIKLENSTGPEFTCHDCLVRKKYHA